jgi:HTH-type transcriptional regulator / antitoxin HigA
MNIRPLRTTSDYEWALVEIEAYFKDVPAPGTAAADRFDVLSVLIEKFEDGNFSVPQADPVDVLEFAIQSMGRTQAELATILGSPSRASEILNRKRKLNLDMIRKISQTWKLPIDALTDDYALELSHA